MSGTEPRRRAACCCGACAIEVTGEPVINAVCHCADCKRRTGSAFGWSVYFPDAAVTATLGAFRTYSPAGKAPGAGAAWQERVFCGSCGTTLSWRSSDFAGLIGIAGGCFLTETPPLPAPTLTVANESRCAWVGLPADWQTDWV
jgi:hypothetical protein